MLTLLTLTELGRLCDHWLAPEESAQRTWDYKSTPFCGVPKRLAIFKTVMLDWAVFEIRRAYILCFQKPHALIGHRSGPMHRHVS